MNKDTKQMNIEVVEPLCTGCRLCEIACSLAHEGTINMEKARIRVTDKYEESLFEPHICRLCDDPPCVAACPTGALSRDEGGVIRMADDNCSGCESCVAACPYDAIWWRKGQDRLFVCDRCDGDPVCIKFCTIGALRKAESAP